MAIAAGLVQSFCVFTDMVLLAEVVDVAKIEL
jgi:hypothetical protein